CPYCIKIFLHLDYTRDPAFFCTILLELAELLIVVFSLLLPRPPLLVCFCCGTAVATRVRI
ncbi:hypothetical protein HN51_016197, partial [Arachis hypogaea]